MWPAIHTRKRPTVDGHALPRRTGFDETTVAIGRPKKPNSTQLDFFRKS
jgi:hypothetical protein